MGTTQEGILSLLMKGPLKPSSMAALLNISRQALHRHLNILLEKKLIKTEGEAPHLSYSLTSQGDESRIQESYLFFSKQLLPKSLKNPFNSTYKRFTTAAQKKSPPDFKFMLDSAAVYSSNIEGNSLNVNSFLNSRAQDKKIRPKEAAEIEDLVEAYQFIQTHSLNEKNMLKAHGMLSQKFLNKARQGIYRKEPVGVFSGRGLEYMAIEPHLLTSEMHHLFKTVTTLLKKPLTPPECFFWASWLHLMLALIHAFADGNGRISRLCEKWFLYEKLGKNTLLLPSEEFYWKNRPAYYAALKIGVNYWEVDFKKSSDFINLLLKSIDE